ncbi:putative component of NuA3 histone acetyltransferase complex [Coemansia sp. RSA 2618]|nr:putative component of NuA3 histone acetyltransferase complex [Coemansia sp. RSA 2618]
MSDIPAEKRARTEAATDDSGPVQLNRGYLDAQFISQFHTAFTDTKLAENTTIDAAEASETAISDEVALETVTSDVATASDTMITPNIRGEITAQPFRTGRLHNVFPVQFLRALRAELGALSWHERANDLYAFRQTDDLALNGNVCIRALRSYLAGDEFVAFMERLTGSRLVRGHLDLAAQRYGQTDHLLCHDDDVQRGSLTRKIAYIIYLTEEWADADGGALGLFHRDEQGLPTAVVERIVPKFNSLGFFLTGHASYHTVEEVTARDRERWSVTGWFYGPADEPADKIAEQLPQSVVLQPSSLLTHPDDASRWISAEYLRASTQAQIQDAFVEQSSTELRSFLRADVFASVRAELEAKWADAKERGPAHVCRYLEPPASDPESVTHGLLAFLRSEQFARVLESLTSLELAQASQQVRRFAHGHYTLVHDHVREPAGLDAVLSLGAGEWQDAWGGAMHYVADTDELLRVNPMPNSLSLVMRDEGTLRFVKYVNHTAEETRDEISMVFIEKEDEE